MREKNRWDLIRDYRELEKILGKAHLIVETVVYPCEDKKKVDKALDTVLPGESEERKIEEYTVLIRKSSDSNDINRIFNLFRKRKILATVRRYAKKYSLQDEIVIYLNKQSAYAGVLNICEPDESPLGEIIIRIKSDKALELLSRLTEF